jgi:hypothetical protein
LSFLSDDELKHADSRKTFLVDSDTPLPKPPYTPAIHKPCSVSITDHQVSMWLSVRLYAIQGDKFLPFMASVLMMTFFPSILSASNAWSG